MSEAAVQLWCVDETEFVFARSAKEAISFATAAFALRGEISGVTEDEMDVRQLGADEPFTFFHPDGREELRTVAEWCAGREPGHFATSEY